MKEKFKKKKAGLKRKGFRGKIKEVNLLTAVFYDGMQRAIIVFDARKSI